MPVIAEEINSFRTEEAQTVIVPGDTLGLEVLSLFNVEAAELDIQVLVQPDGMAVIPGLGPVGVAGRTPAQVTESLTEALAGDLADASKVAVNISVRAPRTFHVIGTVKKPGEFPMPIDGHMTLVEAFAQAGGVGHYTAYLGNILLVRWDHTQQCQVSWVIDARERWWGESETVFLQPNDIVYVPDTPVVRVNSWIDHYIVRNIPFPRIFLPGV